MSAKFICYKFWAVNYSMSLVSLLVGNQLKSICVDNLREWERASSKVKVFLCPVLSFHSQCVATQICLFHWHLGKIMHGFFCKAPCWVWRWHWQWHWRFQGEWPWWWDARGFTCLKRHLLIGESARLCLITRQGIPGARLPPSYPADLNLHVIRRLYLFLRNTFVDLEKYICEFWEIHFWFREIHLSILRDTFVNFEKYNCQFG